MAVLPIFERIETRAIMNLLLNQSLSAKELNSIIVLQKKLCSTSTLYRRLGELVVASILIKNGSDYTVSTYGKNIFSEYKNQIDVLSYKNSQILQQFKKPASFKDVLNRINVSPNYLQKVFKELLDKKLIFEVTQSSDNTRMVKKAGRPKIYYQLTDKGWETVKIVRKLERRASKRR